MIDFFAEKALDALLEASGLKEKLGRNEQIIRLKQKIGLAEIESLEKFEDIYIYAVVNYAFDEAGLRVPKPLLAFFKRKDVRDVFRLAFAQNDPREWLEKGEAIAHHNLSQQLPNINPRQELAIFADIFTKLLQETRTPKEIQAEQKLDSLQQSLQNLQTQMQELTSLEAANQLVISQLAGGQSAGE